MRERDGRGCRSFSLAGHRNFGHTGNWSVDAVTTFWNMFKGAGSFNQALGGWKVDNVQTMGYMFRSATSFNQDLSDWRLNSVTSMIHMFYHSSAFDQDLGWCVDDGVDLEEAFSNTPCASTSCGVGVKGVSCALPSPAPTPAPTDAPRTSSSSGGGDGSIAPASA